MIPEHYAEMARRWVRRAWVEAPARPPADRRRLVGAVEQALRTRARHRVMFRWGTGVGSVALAAAAALVLAPRLGLVTSSSAPVATSSGARTLETPPAVSGAVPAVNGARTLTLLSASGDAKTGASVADTSAGQVARGMTLEAGVELVAPASGQIRIGTAEGTALTLEPGSRLTVSEDSATQRFALRRGAVRARVAKLHVGERFIIDTADAEIEVHGTAFRVALAEPDARCANGKIGSLGSLTRVSVTEGVVTVRSGGRQSRLLPGDEWPKNCAAGIVAAADQPAAPGPRKVVRRVAYEAPRGRASAVSRARAAAASSTAPALSSPAPVVSDTPLSPAPGAVDAPAAAPSLLAAQNDLFAAAVRAKRQGRSAEAIRLFNGLVQQYPNGPLVESALVQRMKLLGVTDRQAAADAATEYLARFPGGFARGDARILANPAARP